MVLRGAGCEICVRAVRAACDVALGDEAEARVGIVDDGDSVLVDDARTHLIISGPTTRGDHQEFEIYKPKIELQVKTKRE